MPRRRVRPERTSFPIDPADIAQRNVEELAADPLYDTDRTVSVLQRERALAVVVGMSIPDVPASVKRVLRFLVERAAN